MAGDAAQEAQAEEVAQGHAAHGHAGANFEAHPKGTFWEQLREFKLLLTHFRLNSKIEI